ncbi:MAG: BrnT family toxin [Deltaproteobacteria bacterium]|nr:BrnT family toxin [Deltaproteobacteria bacterium]
MEFEWNPAKSEANRIKHGIGFEEATALWDDAYFEVKEIARSKDGETRNATLGKMGDKIYVAIWTERGNKARLITVRRARKNEKEIFLKKIQDF